jgi:hypothetical protein
MTILPRMQLTKSGSPLSVKMDGLCSQKIRIRYHTRELGALISRGVRAFVLTAHDVTAEEMAAIFLSARGKIEKFLRSNNGPFMVAVARSGALRILWPEQASKK